MSETDTGELPSVTLFTGGACRGLPGNERADALANAAIDSHRQQA